MGLGQRKIVHPQIFKTVNLALIWSVTLLPQVRFQVCFNSPFTMSSKLNPELSNKQFSILETIIILGFAFFPLFINYPYRVNIFLSWEGAYRLYLGQIPYKDFGLPLGFAYWIIPALFFKVFGPYLITLIKAQVFINILSGFTFRGILKIFEITGAKRLFIIILYTISFSFFNFWPWYNHSVFVFELIGLYFILTFLLGNPKWPYLILGAFFTFVSFFTKQDGGALALMIALAILGYHSVISKNWKILPVFILSYLVFAAVFIVPFLDHGFGYWFNMGQEPHYSRISVHDFLDEIFGASLWGKFYLAIVLVILLIKINTWEKFKIYTKNKKETTFALLTVGILIQALLVQVTSYTPPDNNIYFHSFAFAFILWHLQLPINLNKVLPLGIGVLLIFFWWSGVYYKYITRIYTRIFPTEVAMVKDNVISKNTFVVPVDSSTLNIDMSEWKESKLKSFRGMYLPESTIKGMDRLLESPEIKDKINPKVLNMTELTPLAHEIGYELEKGQPLWYHLNVSIFDKEVQAFSRKIENQYYDVILFEVIPNLNNFYPYGIRDKVQEYYLLKDEFLAPRRPTNATIEVYVPKHPR